MLRLPRFDGHELALRKAIRREFDVLDASVQTSVARWPEFATLADLPTAQKNVAALTHTRLASELGTALSLFPSRRIRSD